MLPRFIIAVAASVLAIIVGTVLTLGVRDTRFSHQPLEIFKDMVVQDKYHTQGTSAFFANGHADRLPPRGAVAWGRDTSQPDDRFATRNADLFKLERLPLAIDRELLARGRERYMIYCQACHGAAGDGMGVTVEYGMVQPTSYHSQRLREMRDGEIFQTITMGKGLMGPVGGRVAPEDRWAIVAYVRVLQRAQMGSLEDVPEAVRQELNQ